MPADAHTTPTTPTMPTTPPPTTTRLRREPSLLLAALCAALVSAQRPPAARGASVPPPPPVSASAAADVFASPDASFTGHLTGGAEVPPTDSAATGDVLAVLTGGPGRYALAYEVDVTGLSSLATSVHFHHAVSPPGAVPTAQTGPVVLSVPSLGNPMSGTWRWDDAASPLTDALVDSLYDGELYVNLHSRGYPDGEIRAQLVIDGEGTPPPPVGGPPAPPSPIPLPPAALLGLAGLALTAVAQRVHRGRPA